MTDVHQIKTAVREDDPMSLCASLGEDRRELASTEKFSRHGPSYPCPYPKIMWSIELRMGNDRGHLSKRDANGPAKASLRSGGTMKLSRHIRRPVGIFAILLAAGA